MHLLEKNVREPNGTDIAVAKISKEDVRFLSQRGGSWQDILTLPRLAKQVYLARAFGLIPFVYLSYSRAAAHSMAYIKYCAAK